MSFCFLYNVVSENHSVKKTPPGGGGEGVYCQLKVYHVSSGVKMTDFRENLYPTKTCFSHVTFDSKDICILGYPV